MPGFSIQGLTRLKPRCCQDVGMSEPWGPPPRSFRLWHDLVSWSEIPEIPILLVAVSWGHSKLLEDILSPYHVAPSIFRVNNGKSLSRGILLLLPVSDFLPSDFSTRFIGLMGPGQAHCGPASFLKSTGLHNKA